MKLIRARGGKTGLLSLAAVLPGFLPFEAGALPDLLLATRLAWESVEYRRQAFSADDCAVQEACVRGTGARKLLLLDAGIKNFGTDLVIGDPRRRPDLFVWSGCHGHYHLKGLATYRVLTLSGRQVAKTYKQGFCLRDDSPTKWTAGPPKFTCEYQGISSGWQDVYDKSLECQWVDITAVPPGTYNLEIKINPQRVFAESNFSNNKVLIRIKVPKYVYY
jgi:lysyl oxidase